MSDLPSHIEVPEADDCAFCDYLAGLRPFSIVSRDELTATMVTQEQRGQPHLLVIPTRHVETVLDISDAEGAALAIAVRRAARAIDQVGERPGIAIWQNNGVSAGQAIPHFHIHVAGTLPGGGTEFGDVRELTLDETEEICAQIRAVSESIDPDPAPDGGNTE